jgi:hypothetical protein
MNVKQVKKIFSILVLLGSFCIKSAENFSKIVPFLFEAGKFVLPGSLLIPTETILHDILFCKKNEGKTPDLSDWNVRDMLKNFAEGALYTLPVFICSYTGGLPQTHVQDLIFPAAYGVLTSAFFGLKNKKLTNSANYTWQEIREHLRTSNVLLTTFFCFSSLYYRGHLFAQSL